MTPDEGLPRMDPADAMARNRIMDRCFILLRAHHVSLSHLTPAIFEQSQFRNPTKYHAFILSTK